MLAANPGSPADSASGSLALAAALVDIRQAYLEPEIAALSERAIDADFATHQPDQAFADG